MEKYVLLTLICLPTLSHGQDSFRPQKQLSAKTVFIYTKQQTLNTAILFPNPPEILDFRDTTSRTPEFTVRACLTNLKSLSDVRLTVNGEVQSIPVQTPAESNTCKGLPYSYELTLPLPTNTISLEARNEGGASVRYAVITIKP